MINVQKETKDINMKIKYDTDEFNSNDSPYADIKDHDSGPQSCCSGILDDISRRKVHYYDDWTNLHSKIILSS